MTLSLPRSSLMRFALIFLVCEALAWCVLSIWDTRYPQYQGTVVFSVMNYGTPLGLFGARTYSLQPDDKNRILLTNMAAAGSGATRWQLSRPAILGDTKNLKDVYRHAERLIMRIFHRYELQEIYHFTVTSDDPTSASQQANQTIQKVEESMLSLLYRREAILKKRYLKELAEIVKRMRENGDEPAATLAEANIRAEEHSIVDFMTPVRIWEHAVPSSQKIRTFDYLLTQSVILFLAMVVGVVDRVVTAKLSSISSLPVV